MLSAWLLRMLISLKGKVCYTFELWRNVKLGCACYRWSWYSAFFLLLNRDGMKTIAFFARYLFTCLQGWSCIRTESKLTLIVCLNILSDLLVAWMQSQPLVINLNVMLRYYLGSLVSSNLPLSGAVCSYFQRWKYINELKILSFAFLWVFSQSAKFLEQCRKCWHSWSWQVIHKL